MPDYTDQRIKHILASSPAIIYACKAYGDYRSTFVSDNITERLGYTVQDCLGNPDFWKNNIHPDDCARVFADFEAIYTNGHHVHEYRFRKKSGDYAWIHDELRLLRDEEGAPFEIVGSWLDITRRKETEIALKKSEALFRDFFQANPVATIISSPAGEVRMVNPAFTQTSGFPPEDVVGHKVEDLGFWQDLADRERMVAAVREVGFIDGLEGTFYGKGNRAIRCLVSSRAVEFAGETNILSIVIDITEQRKTEAALRKLDQSKSDFISMAAHEFRTPLTSIMGYTEILSEPDVATQFSDEQKREFLTEIFESCESLTRIVDDVLDVGRIEAGRSLPLNKEVTELAPLIEKIVARFNHKIAQKISFEVKPDFPATIEIDAHRIAQVIENLLSNAAKYSPDEGQIVVVAEREGDCCKVTVTDQGVGMTAEEISRAFDKYYRVNESSTAKRGIGLGMSIVKQILDDHDGEISITSQPGEGSAVVFKLPVR